MYNKVLKWLKTIKLKGEIIEVGSFNVNGTARDAFPITVGTDIRKGKDVDVVIDGCDLVKKFGKESFDHAVSVDTLEHCEDWKGVVQNLFDVTKIGGNIVLVTVNKNKGKHDYPNDYWRFTLDDLTRMFEGQIIKEEYTFASWVGVVVEKRSNEIDLNNIEPFAMVREEVRA